MAVRRRRNGGLFSAISRRSRRQAKVSEFASAWKDSMRKRRTVRRRARRNPATTTRANPGHGIGGIVMGGVWIGAGMYLGGIVGGFLSPITGGLIGSLPFGGVIQGLLNAYVVQMIAGRFTRNAGMMGAGAFAGTAMGAISGVLGGVTGGLSSAVSSITGGGVTVPKQSGATGVATAGNGQGNVIQMPTGTQG